MTLAVHPRDGCESFLEETDLIYSYEVFRTFSQFGLFVKNRESRFVAISPCLSSVMGCFEPSEAIGKTDYDYTLPMIADQYVADDQEVMRSGVEICDKIEPFAPYSISGQLVATSKIPARTREGKIIGLIGIVRCCSREEQSRGPGINDALTSPASRVVEYVKLHLSKRLLVSELVRVAGIEKDELKKHFSQSLEAELAEVINRIRFRTACRLLTQTGESVSQIAESTGYKSASAFSAKFRKVSSHTPREFRKRSRSLTNGRSMAARMRS